MPVAAGRGAEAGELSAGEGLGAGIWMGTSFTSSFFEPLKQRAAAKKKTPRKKNSGNEKQV
jgi:hypothetical protein